MVTSFLQFEFYTSKLQLLLLASNLGPILLVLLLLLCYISKLPGYWLLFYSNELFDLQNICWLNSISRLLVFKLDWGNFGFDDDIAAPLI